MTTEITTTHYRGRRCFYCKNKIPAQEKHVRFQHSSYKNSSTVDICALCLVRAYREVSPEQIKKMEKRYVLEELRK